MQGEARQEERDECLDRFDDFQKCVLVSTLPAPLVFCARKRNRRAREFFASQPGVVILKRGWIGVQPKHLIDHGRWHRSVFHVCRAYSISLCHIFDLTCVYRKLLDVWSAAMFEPDLLWAGDIALDVSLRLGLTR